VRALRTLLARADWQQHLVSAAGCEPARSGQVLSLRAVMPWWNLRPKAAVRPSDFAQADVTVR
jgi:putative molybdopterin biosynthesis protein